MNAAVRPFEDGDTVVFFGDSLTHGGLYLKYITDFYRTRYPERRIRFVNSGIGGDTAGGAMKRIPEDIAEYDPTWVVFHFGMNDVGRGAYNDESSPETLKTRAGAYADYCRNLDALVGKVAEAAPRAKFIYMTPTIYDDTAIPDIPEDATGWAVVNQKGCSVALSMMAGHVLSKAERDKAIGVDLHTPLQNCLMKRRAAGDRHFMLTRWDRVHPEEAGHAIMAWTFLKAQGVDPVVSDVAVDAATLSASRSDNAVVSDIGECDGGIAFTVLERALPFPIDAKAEPFAGEFDFADSLNREMLSVTGLAPGGYALSIDGRPVGEWTAEELAQGVNLSSVRGTPQCRQAATVFDADERNRAAEGVLRNHHSARWAYSGQTDVDDVAVFAKWFAERDETGHFAQFVPGYVEYWPHYRETRAALLAEQEKVYALARPQPHRYRVTRTVPPCS